MKFNSLVACVASLALSAGCAAEADLDSGESVEALGEAACGTVSGYPYAGASANGATQLIGANPFCSTAVTAATSPNASYTNAGCTNQFVSEVRGTSGRALTASVSWAGPALTTQGACESSVMGVALYGRNLLGGWSKVGQTHLAGRWIPASTGGFQIPAHCEFVRPTGEPALPSLATGHLYNAVRAVGYGLTLFVPQRVRLGVSYGTGPC
ncbi:MAG: hypothetical protein U0324_08165 [Polyangiales bacterium]